MTRETSWACVESTQAPARLQHRARGLVHLGVGERPRVEEQSAVADDAEHGRVAQPKRCGKRLLDRAGGARELREREGAATHAGDGLLHLAADGPQSRSARSRTAST